MDKIRPFAFRLALAAIVLAGLLLRYAGLCESVELHPDELNISIWMNRMHDRGSLLPQCYPGGFFVLANWARLVVENVFLHPLHLWSYFLRSSDSLHPGTFDVVSFGRHFNVWLGSIAILLAAGLARRATGSRAAALSAAALMAFSAFAVEHAHYLESDVAMLATLLLALFLILRFLAMRRLRDWFAAAFAVGFAAGTKFPMAYLLVPLLASIRPGTSGSPRSNWTRAALLGLVAFVAVAAGFVVASPDARTFSSFLSGLREAGTAVFEETEHILGPAAAEPFAREWMNAMNMARFASSLGPGWLALAALGIPLGLLPKWRRFWPVTLLFPLVYLVYVVFAAPWSRSQEFLVLLPNLCLWASLPIAWLWMARLRRCTCKIAAAILFCAAILPCLRSGIAVSSLFAWEDTRRLANRSLASCFPADLPLVAEFYAAPANAGFEAKTLPLPKFEELSPRQLDRHGPLYVLRNADFKGRGFRHPKTGALFPAFARNLDLLDRQGIRLATWAALDSSAPQPYFRSPRIEFWLRLPIPPKPAQDIGIHLPRPTVVRDLGRTTFFGGDLSVGPRQALLVDTRPREFAVAGPGPLDSPVHVVLGTRERAASIRIDGFGQSRRIALGPYDSGVVSLRRPWWRPRASRFERIRVQAESDESGIVYFPCFLRVAFDPIDAASILLDDGHPEKATDFLQSQNALVDADPFWKTLANDASSSGEAIALLSQWRLWLSTPDNSLPALEADGIPLSVWNAFGRFQSGSPRDFIGLIMPPKTDGTTPPPLLESNCEESARWNWREMLALRADQLRQAIDRLNAPIPPLRVGSWLALRNCQIYDDRAVLDFVALQNGVPPLTASLQELRGNHWRTIASAPINRQPAWTEGDIRSVQLPIPQQADLDRLGIALLTDVRFHPSMLPLSGSPPERPFPSLRDLRLAFPSR